MKIVVFARCTTSHQNGLLIAREMKTQGHEVLVKCLLERGECPPYEYPLRPGTAKYRYESRRIEELKQFGPDYLFVTAAGVEPREFFEKISRLGIKLILWNADAYIPGMDIGCWDRYKGVFDLIITSVEGMVKVLKNYAKHIAFLPQYYDDVYYKPTIDRLDPRYEIYDICFIGNTQKGRKVFRREECISALQEFCKVKVIGNITKEPFEQSLYGSEMANIYRQSKITFDTLHIIKKELGWKISDRIFKAMGCGCLFICPPVENLKKFFIPGKHLVTYDGTIEDLKSKVKYYLEHEEEREQIAKCGQEEIMKNHTIGVRVKQYILILNALLP